MSQRQNNSHFVQRLFNWLRRLPTGGRPVLLLTIYTLAGVALEKVAIVFETAHNVTPWDPSSSLHFVLLLGFGLRYTPALLLIPLVNNLALRQDVSLPHLLVAALCLMLGYGGANALLLHRLHIDPRLRRFHDVLWFVVVAGFVAPMVVAACVVTMIAAAGKFPWSMWMSRFLHDWAGEATGIVMLAPPLLILLRKATWFKSHIALDRSIPQQINLRWPKYQEVIDWGVEVVALLVVSWVAYSIPSVNYLDYTYLVFLPIIWIAVRHGFERAALAVLIVNVSVAFFVHIKFGNTNPLALQFGLMAVSHTGLLLGAFVTERYRTQEQLLHNAYHDCLTGLHNRAWLMDKLEQAVARSRQNTDYLFAVLFLDLDRFKIVNDSLGHALGDQMLIAIASRLKICLRHKDTVARFGGDEFTILLDDIQGVKEATRIAERINQELAKSINLEGHEVFTTASIGIAISSTGYQQIEDILRDADIAMYRAKAQGASRYAVFDSAMHDDIVQMSQLENDLRRAVESIENQPSPQFQLHYQPIVLLSSGTISGFEALIRWQHPTQGLLSPDQFIPVAEETGLIIPIGRWVLSEACCQLHSWQVAFRLTSLTIAVNISVRQFLQPDLVEQIEQILRETHLNASSLKLEITESVVIENPEEAFAMLERIKALGVQLAIDDFGLGYSSLSRLHSFRVNTLKIDRFFVNQIGIKGENSEVVQAIIMLAHHLLMSVTAEGVETTAQLAQLRTLNCEEGQGYFFARPLTSQAAEQLLVTVPQW